MIGQTISHYRITGQLGSGGMGVVYEAQDLTLGRRVALKFLPPDVACDSAALDRFLFEARAASALNHPNICTIYAVENSDGKSFIAMELLEGQSLDHKLLGPPLPLDRLLDISIQLTEALEAAHAKGIVHRDIKPANIFITQRSQIKVLDFGLAKLTREAEMAMDTVASQRGPAHLTSPGSTVGTVAYMSPEQARGEDLDARSDLFSLGAVMYQMATGRFPFTGATSAVIFSAILEHDPVPPLELNSELPPKLQEIIEKALEKDRDLRYQSVADLRGDLKRLKRDTESGKRLIIHSLETAEEKDLTSGSLAEGLIDPAWSPDGKVIVCPIQQPGDALSGLVAVDVAKGKRNLFFTSKTRFAGSPVWLPDGTGLLVLQATFNRAQVAFVSYPEGKLFPVTRDTNNYLNLSLASDGHTLTTVLSQAHIDLYLIAAGATSTQASQLTFGAPVDNLSWVPNGQIILAEDGRLDLLNPDSKVKTPLLTQQISWAGSPSSCSNGRVAFSAQPSGENHLNIWSVDASGGNLKQITAGKLDDSPECSSRGVLYQDAELQLMKVPVEGGASQKVSEYTVFSRIAASPDAKLAAFSSYRLGDPKEKLAVVSLDAAQTPKLLEMEKPRESAFPDSRVRFARDGKAVVYSVRTGNADNLWLQPLDGAPGHQITDFKSELIRDFDWSPDGRKIAILRGHIDSDVVLIRDSQVISINVAPASSRVLAMSKPSAGLSCSNLNSTLRTAPTSRQLSDTAQQCGRSFPTSC